MKTCDEDITKEQQLRLRVDAFRLLEQRVHDGTISDLGLLYVLFGVDVLKDWLAFQGED
jgi:hypothetical protein